MKTILILVLTLSAQFLVGQNTFLYRDSLLLQARAELAVFCSDSLAGRGYQQDGHKKAARYIAKRFEEMGLTKGNGDSWFQSFSYPINLVKSLELETNIKKLETGKDVIAFRSSGSGDLDAVKIKDIKYGLKTKASFHNKILLLREGLPPKIASDSEKKKKYKEQARDDWKLKNLMTQQPAAVIILRKKLTASFSPEVGPIPILEVRNDQWNKQIKTASIHLKSGSQQIETQNIMGMIRGSLHPDSFIIVSAHYDHLGTYSGALFTGANDNASGLCMMLSMADHFVKNPPAYSMLFIAFGGEECGLKGSRYYVEEEQIVPLSNIHFLLNLDLMGNGVDGIMAVAGRTFPAIYQELVELNDEMQAVPKVRARKNAPNSDHYFFVEQGVKGFFIYTMGGPSHYHDVFDTAEHLQFSKYVEVRALLIRFLEGLE